MRYMKKLTLSLSFILLVVLSCTKANHINPSSLKGTWQEYETDGSFAGTNFRISFYEDGNFQMLLVNYTDMLPLDPNDSCMYSHYDYIKGQFSVTGNVLHFTGNYTDKDFQVITPNCQGNTDFENSFVSSLKRNSLVMNVNASDEWKKIKMKRE